MSIVSSLFYSTEDHPEDLGFETWRSLMAPMYDVKPAGRGRRQPGGRTLAYLLGDVVANRTVFTAQHVTRDRKRVDTTPDHVLFQVWRTGGYTGEIEGVPVTYGGGTVALSDRRRTLDVRFAPADTIGLIVPRTLLAGIDLDAYGVRFDERRARLLRARITALYRGMAETHQDEVPALRNELLGFLSRILENSPASDGLEGAELDRGLLPLVERTIRSSLAQADLSPQTIAAASRISRSTLYRIFAPLGGVMQYVHEQRLLAIRAALADPVETRTIARIAADHGIGNSAYLSRSFRARFEVTPSAWREHQRTRARTSGQETPDRFWRWFNGLGHEAGSNPFATLAPVRR